jgi:hypothetical protein
MLQHEIEQLNLATSSANWGQLICSTSILEIAKYTELILTDSIKMGPKVSVTSKVRPPLLLVSTPPAPGTSTSFANAVFFLEPSQSNLAFMFN